ncbi:unnamed protein product, partial [Cylicocyclus nassatus]
MINRGIGNYTQMVWQSTKAIGCAVQNCGGMSFVVCNYNPSGNKVYNKIYEAGTPCSKCSGACSNNLCVSGSNAAATNAPTKPTTMATTTKGTPEKTPAAPATGFEKQNPDLCSSSGGMTDNVRETFLNTHNELRALVASGKAKDGLGGYAPQAAGMPKLTYDCEVERYAVAHAAKCQFKHSDKISRANTGENIYMRSPPYSKAKAAEDASKAWFNELEKFGVGNNLTLDSALFNRGVGHYTQMVWQKTKAIGCAVADCNAMSFVVCNYKEAGNMLYGQIYEIGKPCTKCPGSCSNNLCVTGSSVPATTKMQTTKTAKTTTTTKPIKTTTTTKPITTTTTTPTTTTKTKITSTTKASTIITPGVFEKQNANLCPSDSGMTDEVRQKFLDTHNKLRSLAASGKAPDGLGGYAPQAAAMLKLKYDCRLETYATNHATKCQWGHSKPETRNSAGENLYMRSPPYKSTASEQSKAAQKGVEAWFTELSAYGVGQNLRLTKEMMNRGVGHYTQVVWQNTKTIGCAIKDCASYSYVVCNYGDAGNWINQDIYEKGTP